MARFALVSALALAACASAPQAPQQPLPPGPFEVIAEYPLDADLRVRVVLDREARECWGLAVAHGGYDGVTFVGSVPCPEVGEPQP